MNFKVITFRIRLGCPKYGIPVIGGRPNRTQELSGGAPFSTCVGVYKLEKDVPVSFIKVKSCYNRLNISCRYIFACAKTFFPCLEQTIRQL